MPWAASADSDWGRGGDYGLNYYYGGKLHEWIPGTALPEWLFTSESHAQSLSIKFMAWAMCLRPRPYFFTRVR